MKKLDPTGAAARAALSMLLSKREAALGTVAISDVLEALSEDNPTRAELERVFILLGAYASKDDITEAELELPRMVREKRRKPGKGLQ